MSLSANRFVAELERKVRAREDDIASLRAEVKRTEADNSKLMAQVTTLKREPVSVSIPELIEMAHPDIQVERDIASFSATAPAQPIAYVAAQKFKNRTHPF